MAQVVSFKSFIARKKELEGARRIGFDSNDEPIWVGVSNLVTLEEYILKNTKVSWFHEFLTRLGSQYCLGSYRLPYEP